MKSVIFAALLVGCGGGDLHEETSMCTLGPFTVQHCELACSGTYRLTQQGSDTCSARNPSVTGVQQCPYVAVVDGVRGCCGDVGAGSDTIDRFFECD